MKLTRLVGFVASAVVAATLVATIGGWRQVRIGKLLVRYHVLTGALEMKPEGEANWRPAFSKDPSATPVAKPLLQEVALDRLQWGIGGMLVGRATTGPSAIEGRLAMNLVLLEPNGTRVRERSLRVTAEWPANSINWFVLDAGLGVPDGRLRTIVTLEAIQ